MAKRGQLSVFFLIGLMLIITVSIYLSTVTEIKEDKIESEVIEASEQIFTQEENIRNYIDTCLKQSSDSALIIFGMQGGFIYEQVFLPSLEIEDFNIPFYILEGEKISPKLEFFEQAQISQYVEEKVKECTKDLSQFNIEVTLSESELKSKIEDTGVMITLNMPFEIKKGSKTKYNDYAYDYFIESRFKEMIEVSQNLANNELESPGFFDASYALEISGKEFEINIIQYDKYSYFYAIKDLKYSINEFPITYQFAVMYKEAQQ